jgi:ubiquinone/menaquinone biosynthesis C-methylase UbiE
MTPKDWKKSYKTAKPHWAQSLKPSLLAKKFLKILPKKSGNKILEIGIGNGRDSIFFAQNENDVIGIDIVSNAVNLAKKNAAQEKISDLLKFEVGNAENLNFKGQFFDAVYSVSVLHSTNLNKSISEAARVLKKKGKAIIYLYESIEKNNQNFVYYPKNEVEKTLRKNGFVINDSQSKWQKEHKNEKTKILIFKLTKK